MSKFSDEINGLPFDQNAPTDTELQIVNSLFKENYTNFEKLFYGLKDVFLVGVLFFVLSLPQVDTLIKTYYPVANSSIYSLTLAKAILFMIAYFIVKNMYLVQRR
jgi:hypothetical protein